MAFNPPSAGLSTEPIDATTQSDWTFENSNIGISDGSLTLVPVPANTGGGSFPPVTWDAVLDLTNYTLPTDDWVLAADPSSPWASDPTDVTTYPWDNNAPYALKFDFPESGFQKISQLSSGTTFDASTINTTTGLTIELEVLVESEGGDLPSGHLLYVGDGAKFWVIAFRPNGIQMSESVLGVDKPIAPVDLTTYRTVRIGIKGDQVTVGIDDGSVAVFDYVGDPFTNPAEIYYGKGGLNSGDFAVSYLRNMKIFNGLAVDVSPDNTITYSTSNEVATSPAFSPTKAVRRFSGVSVATSADDSIGGTTLLQTQYNNSGVSDWTNHGSTNSINADTTIDLTGVPTVGDGTDQIRFLVDMVGTGALRPTKIDALSVATVFEEALVRTFPNWGPTNGGNTVTLELFNTEGLETPLSTATTSELMYRFDEEAGSTIIDTVNNISGTLNTTAFVRGIDSPLGNETQLGTEGSAVASEAFSTSLDGSVSVSDPNAAGTVATNVNVMALGGAGIPQYDLVSDVDQAGVAATAQRCVATQSAEGVYVDFDHGTTGFHKMNFRLNIEAGQVKITLEDDAASPDGTKFTELASYEYSEAKLFSIITETLSGGQDARFIIEAMDGPATFQISSLSLNEHDPCSASATLTTTTDFDATATNDPNAGWGVDFFYTPLAFNMDFSSGSEILELYVNGAQANNTLKIFQQEDGQVSCYIKFNSGTAYNLHSERRLIISQRHNIAVGYYRRTNTTTGYLALMIDGMVEALVRTNETDGAISFDRLSVGDTGSQSAGMFVIGQLHAQSTPIRPETHAQSLGLADLFFQDTQQIPALTGNGSSTPKSLTLLHFNEHSGAVVDDLAFWGLPTSEVIIPRDQRQGVTRGVTGVMDSAFTLNQVGFDVMSSTDFNDLSANVAHSLFFYIAAMTPDTTSDIVNYVSSTNYGYSLQIDTDGYLVVNIFEGSTTPSRTEVINGLVVGDFSWHAVAVILEPAVGRITVQIDAYNTAIMGNIFSDYLTNGTFDRMHVGYGTYMSLDQFTVLEGVLDQDTINIWRIPSSVKGNPSNEVFVDGVQLATDRVLPVNNRTCYVVMPEHAAGEAHISASFNGVTVSAEQPYSYVASYSREIDQSTIPSGIKRTVSPFRVLDNVPDGQVNLAYLDTRDISPGTNIQTIDLSDLDPDNLSNYLQGEFALASPAATGTEITYTGQIDTKDFLFSNRSAAWRSASSPQPLFHKYLAGRGRHYVNVPGVEVTDVDTIRRAILLVDRAGQPFGREEFPWDIEVSNLDKNGNALPSGVFSVCIFTRFAYLEGETVFVSFRAADALQSFKALPGHREILNTVPIFTQSESTERDNYTLSLQNDATYTVTIRKS